MIGLICMIVTLGNYCNALNPNARFSLIRAPVPITKKICHGTWGIFILDIFLWYFQASLNSDVPIPMEVEILLRLSHLEEIILAHQKTMKLSNHPPDEVL
jgi:hypothetical protein